MNKILKGLFFMFLGTTAFLGAVKAKSEKVNNPIEKIKANYYVKKGTRFNICNDFSTYLSSMTEQEIKDARSIITEKKLNFTLPNSTPSTPERYIQLALQVMGRYPIKISKYRDDWFQMITRIQERSNSDLEVLLLHVDINNDGTKNKVLSASTLSKELGWLHENYVLDENGFLNLKLIKKNYFGGKVFYYEGRTYSYKTILDTYYISDHFPWTESSGAINKKVIGTLIRSSICLIEKQ